MLRGEVSVLFQSQKHKQRGCLVCPITGFAGLNPVQQSEKAQQRKLYDTAQIWSQLRDLYKFWPSFEATPNNPRSPTIFRNQTSFFSEPLTRCSPTRSPLPDVPSTSLGNPLSIASSPEPRLLARLCTAAPRRRMRAPRGGRGDVSSTRVRGLVKKKKKTPIPLHPFLGRSLDRGPAQIVWVVAMISWSLR